MDLEAQSLLRDEEDSVDVRPLWRTQLRIVAVVFVMSSMCGFAFSQAERPPPAAGSLRGFMQKAGRHSETLQLLFPSHAETKIVEANANETSVDGVSKAKKPKRFRNESLKALNSSDLAKFPKRFRHESLKEVGPTTTRATFTTAEAIHYVYYPTKPPSRKFHELDGPDTIKFQKEGQEQEIRAVDTAREIYLYLTQRTQDSLKFK
ncbi:unnamed protein product [Cladocopium goreaui]|uniref:Uncharacterized protein n=1 Tax=Cladocopium goreaui TaxID=2562237 RepID=A0A9P1CG15_9DINO|nr:unnamed protein product [Cladocopium goreaui]